MSQQIEIIVSPDVSATVYQLALRVKHCESELAVAKSDLIKELSRDANFKSAYDLGSTTINVKVKEPSS